MAALQASPHGSEVPTYSTDKSRVEVATHEISSRGSVASDPADDDDDENFLVVSPYPERDHLLDLRSLDTENALLSQALVRMECLRPDYAVAPYLETFNWSEVFEELARQTRQTDHAWKETTFYIVAFRSQIPPSTVYEDLGALDKAAHAEATASGGLLK